MRSRERIALVLIVAGLVLSGRPAQAKTDPKIAACFETQWSSVRYSKSVELCNTEDAAAKERISENLSISCKVEIRDEKRVLGICRAGTVTEMTDANGTDVSTVVLPPARHAQRYEGLHYQNRYTQSPQVPRWQKTLRSVLKMPANKDFKPELVAVLQPSNMEIRLDTKLLAGTSKEIRRIKGYYHAIMATKFETIEVPFEPNQAWVRLTDDLEIQVREARNVGSSFHYRIQTRGDFHRSMRGLSVKDPLPSRIVTAQQFIGVDGKPARQFMGMRGLPLHIGGSGSVGGSKIEVKTIRYVIAVDPTQHEIPFELEHIPLPDATRSTVVP